MLSITVAVAASVRIDPHTAVFIFRIRKFSIDTGSAPDPLCLVHTGLHHPGIHSKALAVGESFALQAKVTPNNATMKTVSWSSSDETVATVDADGVVTALKIGTCKITVATDDGNKTASCVVTVSGTVGIEQIINDHQIYCERGAITVHPARPISIRIIAVTGVSLYGDSIIGTTRIPVSTGIYLIEINENGKRITVKVNVR